LGQRKNDPHQKLEALERWSARATLVILAGIVIEIASLFWFPHDPKERAMSIAADVLIAAGLIVEYVVIGRAIVATGDANRESDETVAAANKTAAEAMKEAAAARERTAAIEKLTAWRHIAPDMRDELVNALRPHSASLDIQLEHERGDAETYSYALEIAGAFFESGIKQIRFDANSWLQSGSFGLAISTGTELTPSPVIDAFARAGMSPQHFANDISRARPASAPPPNLYIFVAPKPPPPLPEWLKRESNI
jgi:hypothetical protein